MHAQLETPLPVSHAGLPREQAAQGSLGGSGAHAELAEAHGRGEVVLDDPGRPTQTRVVRFRQMQRLLGGGDRLVDDDPA